jgi:hypothetical protein
VVVSMVRRRRGTMIIRMVGMRLAFVHMLHNRRMAAANGQPRPSHKKKN